MIQSTEYCMSKVEDDFMERASKNVSGLENSLTKYHIGQQKNTEKNIG